jgi:hypothetical protein
LIEIWYREAYHPAMSQPDVLARPREIFLALLIFCVALAGCTKDKKSQSTETPPRPAANSQANANNTKPPVDTGSQVTTEASDRAVKSEMHNVLFHLTDRSAALLENVSGELWPSGRNELVVFDDKTSFELHVADGTVSITPQSLATVMNKYVFVRDDAPLKDITVEINQGKDQLIIKGKLHSKGDLPFETAGTLSVNPDGRLRMHTEKVKALHVPVKKVMALFGIDLANVISTSKIPGMDTDKNDLLMDLGDLLPPPHIRGKVASVRLGNNAIITIFGDGGKRGEEKGNYMRFEGNRVRFGKLTMQSTDLTVLDLDPADPLDWDQDHYAKQLEAGYSKVTETFGLRAYVKDFGKLPRTTGEKSEANE